ncbi:hypothetical protein [Methanooceanicella nereidis]|uniref:hypothetical protein n=1 Tax=Methanooceanicella nereidis TaxID=2052831 RepID=UPI001E375205|nr:hypothetical protein [Methanocella sp. CWC-04]
MKEGCSCGINFADLARGTPAKDLGFRKVRCVKCGKEFYTDIKDKMHCFDCEKC